MPKMPRSSQNTSRVGANKTTQSLIKKVTTMLEKRKIEGYGFTINRGQIKLTLPHIDEDAKIKLKAAIKEIPGFEKITIEDIKTDKGKINSDEDIEEHFNALLSKYLPKETKISGASKDGVLKIYGTASSVHAKEAILDLARESNGIKKIVDQMRLPSAKSDIDLANHVMLELGNDKTFSAYHLQVMARNGIVFITGNAKDEKSLKLASEIVSKVHGVKSVENAIRLQGEGQTKDDNLRDYVIDAILKAPNIRARDIKVTVVHAHVFLRGYAATTKEIIAAESLVSNISGVKKVFMELEPSL